MPLLQIPTIESLIENINKLNIDSADSYIISYPEFLAYFQRIPVIEKHHLIIAAHFTYGWMPRVLTIGKGDLNDAAVQLNQVRAGLLVQREKLEHLKEIVNNSMVGLSKLLHFVNPELYGIWDSHVARYLSGRSLGHKLMGSVDLYMEYNNLGQDIIRQPAYEFIHNKVVQKTGYEMTRLRTLELSLFLSARNDKRRNLLV